MVHHKSEDSVKYLELIRKTVQSLEPSSAKCQVFCKPIGVVCLELCKTIYETEREQDFVITHCKQLIHQLMQKDRFIEFLGHSRLTMAASILYIAAIKCGCRRSQMEVSLTAGLTIASIQKCYKKLVRKLRCTIEV